LLGIVTGHLMPGTDHTQFGPFLLTMVFCERAAGMKGATRWQVHRAGHVPFQPHAAAGPIQIA